jgi:YVTN family beta-propeller protein
MKQRLALRGLFTSLTCLTAPFAAGLLIAGCVSSSSDDDGAAGGAGYAGAAGYAGQAGDSGAPYPEAGAPLVFPGATRGAAIALSPDDTTAVAVNRDVGSVTVLSVAYPKGLAPVLSKTAEVSLGAGSEPWQVAISPDGRYAYVVLRQSQELVRVDDLAGTPRVGKRIKVGSEPTAVALSPTGARAYVANWVDGTVVVVDTSTFELVRTIDLNAALAATGLVGQVAARPALAHPRSLAVTNDGDADDGDETLVVTEYFAQRKIPEAADGSNADIAQVGLVYRVSTHDYSVKVTELSPLTNIGFKDQNGKVAGCYPNQLQSVTVNGKYAHIVSVCASPRGPIGPNVTTVTCNVAADCSASALVEPACVVPAAGAAKVCVDLASTKTTTAPVVSVVDLQSGYEVKEAAASLNQKWFDEVYIKNKTPDDASRRIPLFANDMAFVPGTSVSYVTANGADAVFRMVHAQNGAPNEFGAPGKPFINLNPAGIDPATAGGVGPTGIAITHLEHEARRFALVVNDITRNVSAIDFNTQAVAGGLTAPAVAPITALPAKDSLDEKRVKGRKFFNTGLGRWSLKGQGWGACQSCHGDGLTDNVTFYFARGPRQSTSLDGTFNSKDPTDQRILNWTAIFDGLTDFELNTRGVSGGVGAIVSNAALATENRIDIAALGHAGLSGSAEDVANPANPLGLAQPSVLNDWAEITEWVRSLRSPRAPTQLAKDAVAKGRDLFVGAGCAGCHGGEKWTISKLFYDPAVTTNEQLKSTSWSAAVAAASFPQTLLPALATADQVMRFNAPNAQAAGAFDQIVCALRNVGTFGVAEAAVATNGLFPEIRANGAPAQGNQAHGNGYNPPSLLAANIGAPYLHHGGVRTLEALFAEDPKFSAHYRALSPNFLKETGPARQDKVNALVAYLLYVDEHAPSIAAPALGPQGGDFCKAPGGTY